MSWIESHVDLGDHPKLIQLCMSLKIRKPDAIGYLTLLWHFTMKYAWRDGDLRRFTPTIICQAVYWKKDESLFISALQNTGWMEKDSLKVHDWLDYAGKLVKDRLYNAKRRKTASNDVPRRKTTATLPYPTSPNRTKPTTPLPPKGEPAIGSVPSLSNDTATAPIPFWQEMVDHMDRTWTAFKKKKTGNEVKYPWPESRDRTWRTLKSSASFYRPFGIMALWDLYLLMNDAWVSKTGHTVEAFIHKIPVLVDDPRWKSLSSKYENLLATPKLNSIGDVMDQIKNGKEAV